jgi:hypothetical protein
MAERRCAGPDLRSSRARFDRGASPAWSRMVVQAISPLLRSDFAQSIAGQTPFGDLTDSFVF